MTELFSYSSRLGTLSELYKNGEFFFTYRNSTSERSFSLYSLSETDKPVSELYLGYSESDVLKSGKDILGETFIANGDPSYTKIKEVLPAITKNCYAFLGGVASSAGLTVDRDGKIYNQLSGRDRTPYPIFEPTVCDASLGSQSPRQCLVGKNLPLLVSVHTDGNNTLEFLYFVEPTECDRDPICWIRVKRYANPEPQNATIEYRVAAISREASETDHWENQPSEELFLDALLDTVAFWADYSEMGARFDIPEKELARVACASAAFSSITCTCGRAHYGHRFYGKELHDNFPPNYIWLIQSLICLGRQDEAKKVFSYFMEHVLRSDGRINYRQGLALVFGASAAEYGMLLDLIARYSKTLETDIKNTATFRKLIGMGEEIIEHISVCSEFEGLKLVKMCAEADTNERVHVYLNNNLWAVRGLEALALLIGKENGKRYILAAQELRNNIYKSLERYSEKNTRFGTLPPFRLGYTATPLTLSRCDDTFRPTDARELEKYFSGRWSRDDSGDGEELIENAYANYRYYPEMLSAMLLPAELADSTVAMREALGGEILGMTRFLDHVDNWPVLNYARFLIETDRIEKYLLLLYAHTAHHGQPELMIYYEQVGISGRVHANDCLPSLTTTPIMLSWCFAYERIDDGTLRLLSAIPKEWYKTGFSVNRLGYSGGNLDISYSGNTVRVRFDSKTENNVELVLRGREAVYAEDIVSGSEFICEIRKNILILKKGITEASITMNN
ncbi:MAG: hypothetical protein E7634_01920 [Ruminococcaceae bacterium]|nr:hypothetical protein [Oscillospiraceae bacterium]